MLANLPVVINKMTEYKQMFTHVLPSQSSKDEHEKLYDVLLASYQKWRTMEESQIRVPLSALHRREQSGCHLHQLLVPLD
jgi:hypothetical protein